MNHFDIDKMAMLLNQTRAIADGRFIFILLIFIPPENNFIALFKVLIQTTRF